MTQRAKAHFVATLGKLDNLAFRQREGLLSTLPLALNAVAEWRSLDTSSIARLFPFSPPDLDTRSGTLYGIDMRACSPVVYDPWDGTHLNANTAVLARSGSGKSFATKLGMLRGLCRVREVAEDSSSGWCCAKRNQTPSHPHFRVPTPQTFFITLLVLQRRIAE